MTRFSKKSTIARRGTLLAIALLCLAILTGFRTGNAVAPGEKPFRGTYEGNVTVPAGTTTMFITFSVWGNATQLGRFRMDAAGDLNLLTLALTNGTTTFTAANGDELHTSYSSSGTPNGDGTYTVTAEHDITGGTGRFEGADGAFSTTSQARIMATLETVTITGKVYMQGTISFR